MNSKAGADEHVDFATPFVTELANAVNLDETAELLLRALEGELETQLLPHRYISETYRVLSREGRGEVNHAVLDLLNDIANRSDWNDDAAVELLLLAKRLFASTDAGQVALVPIARILTNADDYSPEVSVAAGQAAVVLGYRGSPAVWCRLYDLVGDYAVPTVMGGLARTHWNSLLTWVDDHRGDEWIERTAINLLPSLLITQGVERVQQLVALIWRSTSESRQDEIRSFMARKRLAFEVASTKKGVPSDWVPVIRALLNGELAYDVDEAGGVTSYVQAIVGRGQYAFDEFLTTLNRELMSWPTSSADSDVATGAMLDVIVAFRPSSGPRRVVDLLERDDANLDKGVVLRALDAMLGYYPKPPGKNVRDRIYTRYVHALRRLVTRSGLAETALGALLNLGAIDSRSKQFASIIVCDDALQRQVVDFAFASGGNADLLSWLLEACVRESSPDNTLVYEQLIANFRRHAANEFRVNWQSVTLDDITITIARELERHHARLFQRVATTAGQAAYAKIMKE